MLGVGRHPLTRRVQTMPMDDALAVVIDDDAPPADLQPLAKLLLQMAMEQATADVGSAVDGE